MSDGSKRAFPRTWDPGCDADAVQEGMTLREYAAIKAMQGLLARPDSVEVTLDGIATIAVQQADALLAALKETET